MTKDGRFTRGLITFALSIAAVCIIGLFDVQPAFAEGRAIACMRDTGEISALSLDDSARTTDASGISFQHLMSVSDSALASAGVDPAEADDGNSSRLRTMQTSTSASLVLVTSDTYDSATLIALLESRDDVLFAEEDKYRTAEELWGSEYSEPANATAETRSISDIVDSVLSYTKFQWFLNGGVNWADGTGSVSAGLSTSIDFTENKPVIAIVDSGIDATNPNLKEAMVNLAGSKIMQETGCGQYGYNAAWMTEPDEDKTATGPINIHGTHVAGIAAASLANSAGTSGLASGVQIMAVRVGTAGGGFYNSSICEAYSWIVKAKQAGVNVRVANASFGGTMSYKFEQIAQKMLEEAGVAVVYGTGNSNDDLDVTDYSASVNRPENTLLVNALDADGGLASYSNYGQRSTDLYAPGTSVFSTIPTLWAQFNAFTAAENTRVEGAGVISSASEDHTRALVYEGFEGPSTSTEPDANAQADSAINGGLTFRLAGETGNAQTSSESFFLGNQSLQIDVPDGTNVITLISDEIDLSDAITDGDFNLADDFYLGLSAKTSTDTAFIAAQFRLKTDTASTEEAALGESGSDDEEALFSTPLLIAQIDSSWDTNNENSSSTLPSGSTVDWEHFQVKLMIVPDRLAQGMRVNLDSVGIGTGLEPYMVASGTSMAAPVVSAAVAVLANEFPDESPEKLAARIKGGTTFLEGAQAYCKTGGMLNVDASLTDGELSPVPSALSVAGQTATLSGWFFGEGADISLGGTTVSPASWKSDAEGRTIATFELPAGTKEGINEVVVTQNGKTGRAYFDVGALERSTGYEDLPLPNDGEFTAADLCSTDNYVYLLAGPDDVSDRTLYRFDTKAKTWTNACTFEGSGEGLQQGAGTYTCASNDKVYFVVAMYGPGEADPTANFHTLVYVFDERTNECTSMQTNLPFEEATWACWNNQLCAFAGISNEGVPTSEVYAFNTETGVSTLLGNLPRPSLILDVVTSGDKLIVDDFFDKTGNEKEYLYVTDLETTSSYSMDLEHESSLSSKHHLIGTPTGVLMVGLYRYDGDTLTDTAEFDKATGAWTWTNKLFSSSTAFTIRGTALGDKAYVFAHSSSSPDFYLFRSTDIKTTDVPPEENEPDDGDGQQIGQAVTPQEGSSVKLASTGDTVSASALALLTFTAVVSAAIVITEARRRNHGNQARESSYDGDRG